MKCSIPLGLALLLSLASLLSAQEYQGKILVQPELVPESKTIIPGQPLLVGLHLDMADGWHTYWTFSGEAGLPTTVQWDLPEGLRVSPMLSPLPILKTEATGFRAYSYLDEVTHLFYLYASPELTPGTTLRIGARADWLVCEEPCIPGSAEFVLELTVGESGDNESLARDPRLTGALAQLPRPLSQAIPDFTHRWSREGRDLILEAQLPEEKLARLQAFFPLPPDGVFIEIPRAPEILSHQEEGDPAKENFNVRVAIQVNAGMEQLTSLRGLLVFSGEETNDRAGFLF